MNLWFQHPTSITEKPGPRRTLLLISKQSVTNHQDAFDALKEALSTAPELVYPNFSREFILETDTSLNGLGAILSEQGKDIEIHVITYESHPLHPSERSMCIILGLFVRFTI